jgi:hypothetical protein
MISSTASGDSWIHNTQGDFELGTTGNTSVTLSPGNVTLEMNKNWWNSNWYYRIPIEITDNSGNDLTNYQILVIIDTASPISAGKMKVNGEDIRFANATGVLIPHWIESGINSVNTKIWVNVSNIPKASKVLIYMYYGNPLTNNVSDFDDTFTKDFGESGLAGLWHMDEGTGTIMSDSSLYGNTGVLGGDGIGSDLPNWSITDGGQWDGRSDMNFSIGSALELDGIDDYVGIPDHSSFNEIKTINFWFKPADTFTTTAKTTQMIMAKRKVSSDWSGFIIGIQGDAGGQGGRVFLTNDIGSTTANTGCEFQTFFADIWYHVAFVYDAVASRIYIDGVDKTIESDDIACLTDYAAPLWIGKPYGGGSEEYFNGTIDEIRIYSRSLAADEIKAQYERRKYTFMEPSIIIDVEEGKYMDSGTFISSVIDSNGNGTSLNTITWTELLPPSTDITLATRTGDTIIPNEWWSPWSLEATDPISSPISSPRGRYIQYRGTLLTTNNSVTPVLSEIIGDYTLNSVNNVTLSSPVNNSRISDNTPSFTWVFEDPDLDSQAGYTVQIGDDPLFGSINYTSGDIFSPLENWISKSPITDGTWYWRVRAMDEYGLWSDWSEGWTINIDTTPPSFDSGSEGFISYTGESFIIYANFTDIVNVTGATIHYRNETSSWTSMIMNKDFEGEPGSLDKFSITSTDLGISTLNDESDYYFFFEASDGLQNSTHGRAISFFTISVIDNIPPIAVAGPNQTVNEDSIVSLDGTGSSDNDLKGIANYEWTLFDGTQVTLTGPQPHYRFDIPGVYVITLTILDASENPHSDTVTMTVNDITSPRADAGSDLTVVEGTKITFDGTESIDNNGTEGLLYTWTLIANDTLVSLISKNPTYTFWAPGTYVVTLNVSDNAENWDIDTIVITVLPDADGDGISDADDPDDDEDGTFDTEDAFPYDPNEDTDTDGDRIGNNADSDDDGDGSQDSEDAFPLDATEWIDTDGDGRGNNKDSDDDDDGREDSEDFKPLDEDIQDPPVPWWLLIIGLIIGLLLGVLLGRGKGRKEEKTPKEVGLDEKIEEEPRLEENEEVADKQEPENEIHQDKELPEEESTITEEGLSQTQKPD